MHAHVRAAALHDRLDALALAADDAAERRAGDAQPLRRGAQLQGLFHQVRGELAGAHVVRRHEDLGLVAVRPDFLVLSFFLN